MNRYLCFAVLVTEVKSVEIKHPVAAPYCIEAQNYCEAVAAASNHVPLHVGEALAVVQVGRVLNAEAGDKLNLGQSGG